MHEDFIAYIKNKTPTHQENPHWDLKDNIIYHHGKPFEYNEYQTLFDTVKLYFAEWSTALGTEAQVLVVTNSDYQAYYTNYPVLPCGALYKVIVLPQYNTPSNTIIPEEYWHKVVKGNPIMRIHSHHILDAYQSTTDYNSLNSGTLEVVLGRVDKPEYQITYWLSRFGNPEAKNQTYTHTLNYRGNKNDN